MQGRVIKFNLVGGICVLILIISVIVSGVIYIPRIISSIKDKEEPVKTDEQGEFKTTVTINNEEKNITMKLYKSAYGYSMKYDVDSFYIQKDVEEMDEYRSLISDTIFIQVMPKTGNFENVVETLNSNKENVSDTISENEYDVKKVELNGVEAIYEREVNLDGTNYNYFVKKDENNYLMMKIHYGIGFEGIIEPVVEEMVGSFELI